jgi:hypothetical protein
MVADEGPKIRPPAHHEISIPLPSLSAEDRRSQRQTYRDCMEIARQNLGDADRVGDGIGGALLAMWATGHIGVLELLIVKHILATGFWRAT